MVPYTHKVETAIELRDRARKAEEECRKNAGPPGPDNLTLARAELERARKALEDTLEEGRRSGALPGWLR